MSLENALACSLVLGSGRSPRGARWFGLPQLPLFSKAARRM